MKTASIGEFLEKLARQDLLPGGKGDKMQPKDADPKELSMGKRVESEHTSEQPLATEIALDHLSENPHYYSALMACMPEEVKHANIKEAIEAFSGLRKVRMQEAAKGGFGQLGAIPMHGTEAPALSMATTPGRRMPAQAQAAGGVRIHDDVLPPALGRGPAMQFDRTGVNPLGGTMVNPLAQTQVGQRTLGGAYGPRR